MSDNIRHYFGCDTYIREGLIKAGQRVKKHTHSYDHYSILAYGAVVVLANGIMTPYVAPACIKIEANIEHEVLAMADSVWYCIHGTTAEVDDLNSVTIGD
jgi:quercetin dioxygenase-like cupin family protein